MSVSGKVSTGTKLTLNSCGAPEMPEIIKISQTIHPNSSGKSPRLGGADLQRGCRRQSEDVRTMSENSQHNVENEEFEDEERLLAKEAEDIGVKTWQAWAAHDKQAREHYAAFRQKEIEKERVDRHIIHLKHLDKQEAKLRGAVPTFLPKGRQKSAVQKKREARVVDPSYGQSNATPSASQSTLSQSPSLPSIPKNIDIFYTSMVFPDKKRFLIHTPNGLYMVQSVPSLPLATSPRSNAPSPPSPVSSPCAGGSFSTSAVVQLSPVSAQSSHNQHFPLQQQQQQSASANSTPMPSSPIYNQTSAIAQPSHFYQQQAVYSTPVHSQVHANAQPAHCYQQQPAYGTSVHNQSPSVQPAPHLYHHQQQQQHQSYVNPSHNQPATSIHNQTPSASASTQSQSNFCATSIQQHIYKESEEISLMNLPSAADECLPVLKDVSFGETSSAFDSAFNEFFVEDSHSFS
ncbi:hypothetical protein WR25_11625 [Diploscapter pachys]|uniref:Uncharacterized protein n=1 Tax=Diploscapter pachys TaxID=2018661 RepID=A0A2A2KRB0_9BILA|nr:hypothetical protein WR25_11625 [Diploscapter pachys]